MYKKGDFHIHTNASDGIFSPSEVLNIAKDQNVDILAITDHDTTAGIDEALYTGNKLNIKVIPGIELSTLYNGENIHVVGLFKDDKYNSKEFKNILLDMKNYRLWRSQKIVENLDKYFNIKIDHDKIVENTKGLIARPHIAKAIIDAGYADDFDYIFKNYLSNESPAFVPNKKLSTKSGIDLLKKFNALCILAHPVLIKNSSIDDLLKLNFDGIEAIYSLNKKKDTNTFLSKAKEYNKIITAGSDFHGIGRHNKIKTNIGCVNLKSKEIDILLKKLSPV